MEMNLFELHAKVEAYIETVQKRHDQLQKEKMGIFSVDWSLLPETTRVNLQQRCAFLTKELLMLSNKLFQYNFYLEEYKKLETRLQSSSRKISFMSKKQEMSDVQLQIMESYLDLIKKYDMEIDFSDGMTSKEKKNEIISKGNGVSTKACPGCGGTSFFVQNTSQICSECGVETEIFDVSMQNVSRVNIQNNSYERRVHFREALNQFQGKQNTLVKPEIYEMIERQLSKYALLGDTHENRYARVTKQQIFIALKELGLTQHYDDFIMIYHKMTGKAIDQLGVLEDEIMNDFDAFIKEYDQMFSGSTQKRKSFINVRILLYQLLRRHKYSCQIEDFNILKTLDRLSFHDDVISEIFTKLHWNFQSLF